MSKFLKMLADKQKRQLLQEFELIHIRFDNDAAQSLSESNEEEFYQYISKLELAEDNSVIFTFDNVELRLNTYQFTDTESKNKEGTQNFRIQLMKNWQLYLDTKKEMKEFMVGVIIEEVD